MKFRVRLGVATILLTAIFLYLIFVNTRHFQANGVEQDNDYVEFDDDSKVPTETKHPVDPNKDFLGVEFDNAAVEILIKKYLKLYRLDSNSTSMSYSDVWRLAEGWVTIRQIHPDVAKGIGSILSAMSNAPIINADIGHRGTQLKLTLTLEGGQMVVFKPQWYERNFVVDGLPYDGHDRHNGEIAAFHINRILGYRRVPLTAGRNVDLISDILPVATERLQKTFFKNGSNTCFYGKCLYCKGELSGVCARGSSMEGAVVLWLPKRFKFQQYPHPWRRTYLPAKIARWEYDDAHYCSDIQQMALYNTGPILMDIIDACVFDYIIGNADRHHYETFKNESDSMLVMFDNAKSFGNPFHDELSILAPLNQCKQIRRSTVERLNQLRDGVLIRVLKAILDRDPLSPILAEPHYAAMERRLEFIINLIATQHFHFVEADDKMLKSTTSHLANRQNGFKQDSKLK